MRANPALWFCVVGVCGSVFGAQTQFPYELTVTADSVDVRSGPGEQYYATDRLPIGAKIQVYRHDSAWLAIRPPDGSFSLVKSEHLTSTNQADVAKVTKNDARCHVGSKFTEIGDPVSWVRLRKNELVELIDGKKAEIDATTDDAEDTWRRISPPAGEFRWVKVADMRAAVPKTLGERAESSSGDVITIPMQDEQTSAGLDTKEEETETADEETAEESGPSENKWIARSPRSHDSLDDIELRLSLMVAKDMRAWRLGQLRERVEAIKQNADSKDDQSRAKLLLKRIGKFEELQNSFVQTMGDTYLPDGPGPDVPTNDVLTAVERVTGVRYDGSGWLVPVHSTKQTAPPYALLDAEGEVLQYVSPAPGLNLHRYVRKQVGLFGHRGYQQSLKKPHLTAERVVDLKRHLR